MSPHGATRAVRRAHRHRLIQRVSGYSPWFRERANRLFNNRKFCTCCISFCGNPRRYEVGVRSLTLAERRELDKARTELKEMSAL